jgi:hypothetical protein
MLLIVDGNFILGLLNCMGMADVSSVSEVCVASIFRECGRVSVGYRFENNGWEEVGVDASSKSIGRKGWESCETGRFKDHGVNPKVRANEIR